MKCYQCDRPPMFSVGENNHIPLCLDCYSKFSRINNVQYLQNAAMMNQALDDMDAITGFPNSGGRIPIQAIAQAMQGSHTLNNIQISQSQIGVLNTGSIKKIDAAITLSKGSDIEEIGRLIKDLTQAAIQSEDLGAGQKNEIIDLTESLAEELIGKRKPATITAVMKAITEKVSDAGALAGAAEKLWDTIQNLPNF